MILPKDLLNDAEKGNRTAEFLEKPEDSQPYPTATELSRRAGLANFQSAFGQNEG